MWSLWNSTEFLVSHVWGWRWRRRRGRRKRLFAYHVKWTNGQEYMNFNDVIDRVSAWVRKIVSQWVSEVEWGGVVAIAIAIAIAEISICESSSPEPQEHVMKQTQHNVVYTKHLMEKEGRKEGRGEGREVLKERMYVLKRRKDRIRIRIRIKQQGCVFILFKLSFEFLPTLSTCVCVCVYVCVRIYTLLFIYITFRHTEE